MRLPLGPAALMAVALLMLLPFVEFSCKDRKVVVLNGYETAFGKKMEADLPFGDFFKNDQQGSNPSVNFKIEDTERNGGNKWVMFAFFAAVGGGVLALGFRFAGVAGGAAAVILFFVAQSDIQKQIQVEQVQLLVVNFAIGFWACIAAAALGAVLCLTDKGK